MTRDNYSDLSIIEMIEAGGKKREEAFVYLLKKEESQGFIQKALARYHFNEADKEEIINDCLLALNMAIKEKRLKKDVNIIAYLIGVAKNLVLSRIRSERRYKKLNETYVALNRFEKEITIDYLIIKKESRSALIQVIEQLSDTCKEIIFLSLIKEWTNQEIMVKLGFKNDQVMRTKKSKCLKGLIEQIKKRNLKLI